MTESGTNAKLWIKGCRVIDPVNRVDETRDVYVEDGVYVEEPGAGFRESATCIDAGGLCLAPSLTDLQVHLREPGDTHKETIRSGTRAAFESGIMGDRRVTLNALVMPTSQSVLDYVATHQLAVGYVTFDHLMPSVRAVPVEGIPPAREHVASGAYPLLRTLYLAVQEGAQPPADDFVIHALSAEGQRILSKHHTPLN